MEQITTKTAYRTKAVDVDEKGRVVIAVNAFGNVDGDNDISMKGSFTKTLGENFSRVKWFLNHNRGILLGVPLSGRETDDYLEMTAQFNMKKQISLETYEDYKLYAENGKTLEHSIGVNAIKRDPTDQRKVSEWKLYEFSTLTNWGANPNTPLLNIKSEKEAQELLPMLEKMLKGHYSDERLKSVEEKISMLTKAIRGEEIVTCPNCGKTFDYNSQNELTMENQVIETARMYAQWIMEDKVREEMDKLKPEIQYQVEHIIQSRKSIDDIISYVRCPHCWARVSRANKAVEPDASTQTTKSNNPQSRPKDTLHFGFIKK